jgi:hypothetical protein
MDPLRVSPASGPFADPAEVEQCESGGNVLVVQTYPPGIVYYKVTGRLVKGLVPTIVKWIDRARERGLATKFVDLWETTGYEAEAREQITAKQRPTISQVLLEHVLVRSRLVAMGISVANLVLAWKLRMYSEREPFERVFLSTLTEQRRRDAAGR